MVIMKVLYWVLIALFSYSCATENASVKSKNENKQVIKGEAQGTTYSIVYYGDENIKKESIDSVLLAIDLSLSNWNKQSLLSAYNNGVDSIKLDDHFFKNLILSVLVSGNTNGAFNPLIKPLIDYYGLGAEENNVSDIDSATVTEMLTKLKLDSIMISDGRRALPITQIMQSSYKPEYYTLLQSNNPFQLDFNAIAQGYSVDVISDYIMSKGISNFLVELGGEMIAKGKHPNCKEWTVGIDKPLEEGGRELQAKLKLQNKAIATSGNYRKFKEIDGVKYHHTINPKTGFPAKNRLLSATVVTSECSWADAYATAFMVLGVDKSVELIESGNLGEVDVFFIYSGSEGEYQFYQTEGLKKNIELIEN